MTNLHDINLIAVTK